MPCFGPCTASHRGPHLLVKQRRMAQDSDRTDDQWQRKGVRLVTRPQVKPKSGNLAGATENPLYCITWAALATMTCNSQRLRNKKREASRASVPNIQRRKKKKLALPTGPFTCSADVEPFCGKRVAALQRAQRPARICHSRTRCSCSAFHCNPLGTAGRRSGEAVGKACLFLNIALKRSLKLRLAQACQ